MVGHKCPDHGPFLAGLQTLRRIIDRLVLAIAGERSLIGKILEVGHRFVG